MARDPINEIARLSNEIKQIKKGQRYAHGGSIESSSLEVRDGGSLRAILGVQSDGTTAVNIVNGPPPPAPSAPVLAAGRGGVNATWTGTFAGGAVIPLDWARVEVHASLVSGFTPVPATLVTTIETAQGGTVIVPCDTPVYVRLVARNTSGAASDPSAQAGPVGPAPVVADDILDGIVTASKIAANAVTVNALTEALADTASQRWVDSMSDPSTWSVTQTGPGATWLQPLPVSDAPTGATVGQAFGYVRIRGTTTIPYDPDVLYRVSARIRTTVQPTTPDSVYVGVLGLAADGVTLVNRTGANNASSHTYVAASDKAIAAADGWVVVTGYLKGRAATGSAGPNPDPRTPGQVHTNTRYITPYVWLNYNQNATSAVGTMQVDAVTVEALKTGIVDSTNLVAGSVTTAALAADSVTATQILANAVTAAKINAGAVTTAKLDALAVTSDKIAANAITAGKILAGSVDATALAADAITGKTITGGTITGSLFQTAASGQRITINEAGANKVLLYDATSAIGELSSQGLLVKGTSNAIIWLDPNSVYPNLRLTTANQANSAVINVVETTPGSADLGMNSGPFTATDTSVRKWRTFFGNDFWVAERINSTDDTNYKGGRISLRSDTAIIGYLEKDDPTKNTYLNFTNSNLTQLTKSRLEIYPPQSANSAVYVSTDAGHTGNMLRLNNGGSDKFTVDKDGNTTIAGTLTVTGRVKPSTGETGTVALQNGWTAYDSTNYGTPTIRKSADGLVFLFGRIQAGTTANTTIVATIPSTYWPPVRHAFPHRAPLPNVDVTILVNELGEIRIYDISGTITNLSLSGIVWPMF
jgi:hypothetical protein